VQFFYYFGVHKVRRNDRKIVTTNKMKSFYDAITPFLVSTDSKKFYIKDDPSGHIQ